MHRGECRSAETRIHQSDEKRPGHRNPSIDGRASHAVTVMVPVIPGWKAQKKEYVPGVANVALNASSLAMSLDLAGDPEGNTTL